MEFKQEQEGRLFILLGFDTLFSIKMNELKSNDGRLEMMFNHSTHKQPADEQPEDDDDSSADYPLGMGLFVTHGAGGSKLHFFGGENLEHTDPFDCYNIDIDIGLQNHRPVICKYFDMKFHIGTPRPYFDQDHWSNIWLNKKVFTFTPLLTRDYTSDPLPDHFGYKVRPIVVSISNKIYVLTTRPISVTLNRAGIYETQRLFEVFEPENGRWRELPNPPLSLYDDIVGNYGEEYHELRINHCVFKNKLLIITQIGQYLYDTILETWVDVPYPDPYPTSIVASLEYNDHLLAFLELEGSTKNKLVAYDLASFGKENKRSTLAKALLEEEDKTRYRFTFGASLSLVENNVISLVFHCLFRSRFRLHVYLLQVTTDHDQSSISAKVDAHQVFDLPSPLGSEPYILSTFLIKENIEGSNNAGESSHSVFVKNLPCTVTFDIRQEFESLGFGEIKPDGIYLYSKEQCAFVEFEDVESLKKAIKASPIDIAGQKVDIQEVYMASRSCRSWWKARKEGSEVSKMEEIADQVSKMEVHVETSEMLGRNAGEETIWE